MSITFNFLPAGYGDAILISFDGKNIFVDGGTKKNYLHKSIQKIKSNKQLIDLMVLTHIDSDHIGGFIGILKNEEDGRLVQKVWFNSLDKANFIPSFTDSNETSARQGVTFQDRVKELAKENKLTYDDQIFIEAKPEKFEIFPHLEVNILSPTKEKLDILASSILESVSETRETATKTRINFCTIEQLAQYEFKKDSSPTNAASIVLLLTYKEEYKFLLLADADIELVTNSLINLGYSKKNKLKINFVKLSHHGSKNNLNQAFLELIDTDTFVILTNAGKHGHPDTETLCKIIMNPERNLGKKINFFLNYDSVYNSLKDNPVFEPEQRKKYNFSFFSKENEPLIFG
ncbi:ComEC/Rec2 family competence protein [Thioflexithrix psekupsensis]|uniref:Metallo-beta-lactamase domain-containing protein n=1 Tax=Thioflexithrix psekupsensis TaxID=1570016 RepID=A0A251X541_9GAMM|nr:MBL fold metallo-hydrolase [Thioflexithrix psekupsensis]OUD12218.1 hypothetical protein TPSD3_13935 [Thioflexithrix psekupsensis]